MAGKADLNEGGDARRAARWRTFLADAEEALAAGQPQDAERRARALSAIARAALDIEQWKEQCAGPQAAEMEGDGEVFRRELELRIDRWRREQGSHPLFDEDPQP
jgi:hypothetical protein